MRQPLKLLFSQKKSNILLSSSIVFGLLLGWPDLPFVFSGAEIISAVFLKLLKLLSLPLVFFAIGSTITSIKNLRSMVAVVRSSLYYTFLTTVISASIALTLVVIVKPSIHQDGLTMNIETNSTGYFAVLSNTIPANVLEPFLESNVIAAAFLSVLLASFSLSLPEDERLFVRSAFNTFFSLLLSISKGILKTLPLATFSFSLLFIREMRTGDLEFTKFGRYLFCVITANCLQGLVVLPLLLKLKKISPIRTFRLMSRPLATAFFSKSSAATLPLTMEVSEENLHINPTISRFVFPLCSVINMNACAAFILITVLFIGASNGIIFSPLSMISWVFIATLAAIGNAGVPMGCYFLTSSLLSSMNIPLGLLGLILPAYALLDMLETFINVWSDCCVVSIINKKFLQNKELPFCPFPKK
ncbi:dicarboxylate/amino acid:cation symporter [Chlamydia sp.]|uniref:dicarboxylate/amino acid:cation symporter n=1 Tax=Chlamydia sp. TaxID=35827 RepID=UPI0025BC40B7|nr:dicarboxylate/amino acid:cation symporter [Chlamydia sp.]MBQ8499050.1 dicarboxylate/amino acid:cation symporter [Chlamydia sp.]